MAGVPVTIVERAVFDEMRRIGSVPRAVEVIDMAIAAKLTDLERVAEYIAIRPAWTGVPMTRLALPLASADSRSPQETRMRLTWVLNAGLPTPVCNRPVFDLDGRLLGIPDLFDPVAGLVGEYDGADHRAEDRRARDAVREERFRDHGLEYVALVRGDLGGRPTPPTASWPRVPGRSSWPSGIAVGRSTLPRGGAESDSPARNAPPGRHFWCQT